MTSRCARRFCRGTRNSRCVYVPCRLSSILASGGLLTILTYTAYPWIVHVNPWCAGTAGSGTTAREVLHSVGMEVEDSGGFRIWQQLRCVHLPHPDPVSPLPSFVRLKLTLVGVPLHPLYKSIGTLLDDFALDHPFLKNCAPFVLAHPYLIPSTDYSKNLPPPSLPLYVRSRLRLIHSPPTSATPSESSPITSKPGTDIFASSMNVTRGAVEATGQAFVTIGASMDVRKWNWPGYLTFTRGVSPRPAPQDQLADAKNSPEEKPEDATVDTVAGGPDFPGPEAGLPGEVDRESLHEAMSTDGIEMIQQKLPSEEGNGSAIDSTSQTGEISADADVTPLAASDSLQDEQDPSSSSSPPSPSTPVVHPPTLTSPPSLSSSQSTIPVPIPAPSFRSFSLHFAFRDDPLATAPRRVLYIIVSEHSDTAPHLLNLVTERAGHICFPRTHA